MAADLHIHAYVGLTEDDLREFFSHTLGSKWFNLSRRQGDEWDRAYEKIMNAPNIWVGEVSWLKAALTEDPETFVPPVVQQVHDLIGEDLPILDEALRDKIVAAFGAKNGTGYGVASQKEVEGWLNEHIGQKLFTVSW